MGGGGGGGNTGGSSGFFKYQETDPLSGTTKISVVIGVGGTGSFGTGHDGGSTTVTVAGTRNYTVVGRGGGGDGGAGWSGGSNEAAGGTNGASGDGGGNGNGLGLPKVCDDAIILGPGKGGDFTEVSSLQRN